MKKNSIRISRMIWEAVASIKSSDTENMIMARASYGNNQKTMQEDSSLVYLLKRYSWVPDKSGKLRRPADIYTKDIADDLKYNSRNQILKALDFGSALREEDKLTKEIEKYTKKNGLVMISETEYKEFAKWKRSAGKTTSKKKTSNTRKKS